MKNLNLLLVVLLVIAAFLVGSLWTEVRSLRKEAISPTPLPTRTKINVDVGHFPPLGDKNAKITIVEFADFQCPFCRNFLENTLSEVKKDYIDKGKVKFYYRNFAFLGSESTWAAEASECANEQDKFWEFHDYLFAHQQGENLGTFSKDNLKKFATELGFDTQKFSGCLDSEKYKTNVEKDLAEGRQAGVSGTPATFVNGMLIGGAQPYSNFKAIIDEKLK